MIATFIALLIIANVPCVAIGVHSCGCAISAMNSTTHRGLFWSFVVLGIGYVCQLAAAIDYLLGNALAWPWLFLCGVLLANGSLAAVYLLSRRQCACAICPMRNPGKKS